MSAVWKVNDMDRRKGSALIPIIVALIIGAAVAVFGVLGYLKYTGMVVIDKSEYDNVLSINHNYSKFFEIQNLIDKKFLWESDSKAEMEAVYRAMVGSLGDEYSAYLNEDELKELEMNIKRSFTGIGIIFLKNEKGEMQVSEVMKGGPANGAGILKDDIITLVDGKPYSDLSEAADAIRGEAGSTVVITIKRGSEPEKEYKIVRGEVTSSSIESKSIDDSTGYIRIISFGDNTYKDFDKAFSLFEEEHKKGVIIDLRNNPGGLFEEGIKIADRLIGSNRIITYTENKEGEKYEYMSDEKSTALKIVVLVNKNTASTSEVLTAALKGNNLCTVIGTNTFGKGIVQETTIFNDGTAVKLTTNQYFGPNGEIIHGKGIVPDTAIELPEADKDGTVKDNQLEAAIALINK